MKHLIADIETYPIPDAEQYLTLPVEPIEPDLSTITPAKNVKKAELVEASLDARKAAALDDYATKLFAYHTQRAEMIDRCAVKPDLLRVVCLGWQFEDDAQPTIKVCRNETEERDAIELLWREYRACRDATFITFAGRTFDLPALMRRSLYLRIDCPLRRADLDRYRSRHVDLLQELSFDGLIDMRSLKFYLSRFGIVNDDLTTGKDIAALVKAGDWDGVRAHCAADVVGTKRLAERLGFLKRAPVVQEPEEVAEVF